MILVTTCSPVIFDAGKVVGVKGECKQIFYRITVLAWILHTHTHIQRC